MRASIFIRYRLTDRMEGRIFQWYDKHTHTHIYMKSESQMFCYVPFDSVRFGWAWLKWKKLYQQEKKPRQLAWRVLYIIYTAFAVLCFVLLLCRSICHFSCNDAHVHNHNTVLHWIMRSDTNQFHNFLIIILFIRNDLCWSLISVSISLSVGSTWLVGCSVDCWLSISSSVVIYSITGPCRIYLALVWPTKFRIFPWKIPSTNHNSV